MFLRSFKAFLINRVFIYSNLIFSVCRVVLMVNERICIYLLIGLWFFEFKVLNKKRGAYYDRPPRCSLFIVQNCVLSVCKLA